MFSKKIIFVIALLSLAAVFAVAHAEDAELHAQQAALNPGLGLSETMAAAFGLVLLLGIASAVMGEKLGRAGKKTAFAAIAGVSALATLYLIYKIVLLFTASASGGPVHWHADFEVWACGERISLEEAGGWSTRVGPLLLHHHGDDRMHVEGVVRDFKDVTVGKFFEAIGGKFTADVLALRDGKGVLRAWQNGDECSDGRSGALKFFVNGLPNGQFGEYNIAKETDIPPGDVLKIVFDAS